MNITKMLAAAGILALTSAPLLAADKHLMGFFVTSVGMGNGANLGGFERALMPIAPTSSDAPRSTRTAT